MTRIPLASEKTLRDEFAGQALAGFMARPSLVGINVAFCCYEQADSMMDERLRREAVVKQSSTTPDSGKMAELQAANTAANREVERLRTELFKFADSHAKLNIANRELVEALEELLESKSKTATRVMEAQDAARAILFKHKGAK